MFAMDKKTNTQAEKVELGTEFEATFVLGGRSVDEIRELLSSKGAILVRPEYTQYRIVFHPPESCIVKNAFVRVRKEGESVITMSLKVFGEGNRISDQKEIELGVSSFEDAKNFLVALGATVKAEQETRRELWTLDGADITIDTWPFLDPFIEVEGPDEHVVRSVSEKLGMTWENALFDGVAAQYEAKYGIPASVVNNETPRIVFDMENPFVKKDNV